MLINIGTWFLFAIGNNPHNVWPEVLMTTAMVLIPWVARNLVKRRHPLANPRSLGWFELLVFVVGPALMVQFGGAAREFHLTVQTSESAPGFTVELVGAIVILQLLYLLIVRVIVGWGIAAMMIWLLRELANSVVAFYGALSRTLPLLLGVVTFFFFTAEVWQSIGRLHFVNYTILLALFILLSAMFVRRQQRDIGDLACFATVDEFTAATPDGLPLEPPVEERFPLACPLDRGARMELRLIAVLGRLVVAVVVALGIGLVFFVMGLISVDTSTVKAWTMATPHRLFALRIPRGEWLVTWEHLKVTGFLATFSGFYFSVVSATDPALREGITDTAEDAVREACAVRIMALDAQGELAR